MTQNVTESEGKYMDAQKIGKRLVALRGARRREDVAAAVGISFSALCMYETGRRIARDDVKIALAEYYGVRVEDIFFTGMSRNETKRMGGKRQ